jgi:hypothetical protein
MLKRILVGCVVAICVWTAPVKAADEKAPAVIVRVKSIDGLLEDGSYIAKLLGFEEEAKQADGFLHALLGEKGSEGIDPRRPIGAYGSVSEDVRNSVGAVMIPIGEEKAFLDLLERFNVQTKKNDDGTYTVTPPAIPVPLPIFMRLANKYAYVTVQNAANLAPERLLAPADVFGTEPLKTLSASFFFDRVPADVKDFVMGGLDMRLAEEQGKEQPGETKVQKTLRIEILKELSKHAAMLIKDSGRLDVVVNIDKAAGEVTADLNMSGRKGSQLATAISGMGQSKSVSAAVPGAGAAWVMSAHIILPESIRKALEPVIDEAIAKMISDADEKGREHARTLLTVLTPTLKSGDIDLAMGLHGPTGDKRYTIVAGLKVKQGNEIETAVRGIVAKIPEAERVIFKLDADSAGSTKIHRLDAQFAYNEQSRKYFGSNPILFGVTPELFVAAVGPDASKAVKQGLATQPVTGSLLQLDMGMARLIPFIQESPSQNNVSPEELEKAAKEAFGSDGKDSDSIRFMVSGGERLTVRASVKASAIKFFGKIAPRAQAAAATDE